MNLRKLSNETLDANLKSLVQQERELTSEILGHIAEVDRRKLYLKLSYRSLFDYLSQHLGYSNGNAQRHLDAARLLNDVPDLNERLESGKLNQSHVTLVQKAIRQKKKETRVSISKEEKQALVQQVMGKTQAESEKIVAQSLDLKIKQAPKTLHQQDGSVRLEVTLSKEQWEKLTQMRELLSNSLPAGSWEEVLEYVADKVIAQKTKARTEPKPSSNQEVISTSVRKFILQRDKCCQHTNPINNRRCESKWNLQVDHIQPLWAGGTSAAENLQALCAAHNQQKYRDEAGIRPA
jgi:hypothetical protein